MWCSQYDKPVGLEITQGTGYYDTDVAKAARAREDAAQAAMAKSCRAYFPDVIVTKRT